MVADHLPENFGTKLALAQHPDLAAWNAKRGDRFAYCGKCGVVMPNARYNGHMAEVHPDPKRGR